MTETSSLHVRQCRYKRDNHLLKLILLPEQIGLLPLSVEVLQVKLMVNILTNDPYSERVVHRLIEEVPEELNHIRMLLCFEKLDRLFLMIFEK